MPHKSVYLSLRTPPILWVRQDRHFYLCFFLFWRKVSNATTNIPVATTLSWGFSYSYYNASRIWVQSLYASFLIHFTMCKKEICNCLQLHISNIISYSSTTSFIEKLILPILSFPRQTTFTLSPNVRTSSTCLILSLEILEM